MVSEMKDRVLKELQGTWVVLEIAPQTKGQKEDHRGRSRRGCLEISISCCQKAESKAQVVREVEGGGIGASTSPVI